MNMAVAAVLCWKIRVLVSIAHQNAAGLHIRRAHGAGRKYFFGFP